jgi:hypothetical protein
MMMAELIVGLGPEHQKEQNLKSEENQEAAGSRLLEPRWLVGMMAKISPEPEHQKKEYLKASREL